VIPLYRKQKYIRAKVIAIDVDGTLIINGQVNDRLVAWCREKKEAGFQMILWSARGEKNAKNAAKQSKTEDLFAHILSKPAYIVDDKGWRWTKYTRILNEFIK